MVAPPESNRPLRLLVLGGTSFLGRAFVEAALEEGHQPTLFNRGKTNPGLFAGRVETVLGDRTRDLRPLAGRSFDGVVDVACYFPADAARAVAALADATARYLFVSTVSVYADERTVNDEDSAVAELTDPADTGLESYGARKAACEEIVRSRLGQRATIVRPGLIVGPHDPTDRFGYWPRRMAEGGRVLAPGEPSDPVQFIDVRDLAQFMLRLVVEERPGTFNATGEPIEFGSFLEGCEAALGAAAEVVWVPSARLLDAGVEPWTELPLWLGDPELLVASRVDISRARAAGLSFRPLGETVRGALEQPARRQLSSLDREKEARLLAELAG